MGIGTGGRAEQPLPEEGVGPDTIVEPPVDVMDRGPRVAIKNATHRQIAAVEGRIRSVEVSPISGNPALPLSPLTTTAASWQRHRRRTHQTVSRT